MLDWWCGQERGAADVSNIPGEMIKDMPTDNIIAEREFAKFDHVSRVARYRNHKFTAKGIRADMMLHQNSDGESTVSKATKQF